MKLKKNQTRLGLEALEDRSVPAVLSVNLVGADLVVATDNSADNYTVNLTANDTVEVTDGGGLEGSFTGVTGNIIFTGGSAADNVSVNLNGFALTGGLDFNLDGDQDRLVINGGGGQINGNVQINTDGENDHVELQNLAIAGCLAIDGGGGYNCIVVGECTSVSVTGNVAIVSGDNGSNIDVSAEIGGTLEVTTGVAGDSISLDKSEVAGAVTLDTGDGDDHVRLTDSTLSADVTVTLGDGGDCVYLDPVIIYGDFNLDTGAGCNDITLDGLYLQGDLNHTSVGDDDIEVRRSVLGGHASFNITDAENGAIDLSICDTTLATFLSITGGGRRDQVDLRNVQVRENLAFDLGVGCDQVTISGSQVLGNVTLLGAGDLSFRACDTQIVGYLSLNQTSAEEGARIQVRLDGVAIGSFLSITGGLGSDDIDLEAVTVGENFGLRLFGGCDEVEVDGAFIKGDAFHFGAGDQDISIRDTHFNGFATFTITDAENGQLDLGICDSTVNGTLSVTGGDQGDEVRLKGVTVKEDVNLEMGEGCDETTIVGSQVFGDLNHHGGGDQSIAIFGSQIYGDVSLNQTSTAEDASIHVQICDTVIGSFLSIAGGAGSDCIGLHGVTVGENLGLNLLGGEDEVTVEDSAIQGDFTHDGTGWQEIDLEDVQVVGDVNINGLAQDVQIEADLENVTVGGNLYVLGGSSGDQVDLEEVSVHGDLSIQTEAGEDCVQLESVLVTGITNVNLGGEGDQATIKDSTFTGPVTIHGGEGDNSLRIEKWANNVSSMFLGAFTYEGGADNDQVTLGDHRRHRDDFSIFAGAASFDGGGGENFLNADLAVFHQDPTIINFNTGPV